MTGDKGLLDGDSFAKIIDRYLYVLRNWVKW